MFRGVVPHPSRWRKNNNRGIGGKQVKETEGAKVYLSLLVDGGGETDRPWCHNMLEVILFLSRFEFSKIKNHRYKVLCYSKYSN